MRVAYVAGSTQRICQLTGECDRERGRYTANRTETRAGLVGTDLGASFEHEGRLWFVFGDANPAGEFISFDPAMAGPCAAARLTRNVPRAGSSRREIGSGHVSAVGRRERPGGSAGADPPGLVS